jgi:pimeloyl-ACP methyl ester carboxylesterase
VSTAERAMALLPDPAGQGRLQVVPGAGHLLPVTHPRELRRAIVAALAHLGALA